MHHNMGSVEAGLSDFKHISPRTRVGCYSIHIIARFRIGDHIRVDVFEIYNSQLKVDIDIGGVTLTPVLCDISARLIAEGYHTLARHIFDRFEINWAYRFSTILGMFAIRLTAVSQVRSTM